MNTRTTADTALAWSLFVVTAITAIYWIVWYLVPGGQQDLSVLPNDVAHVRFENAFVLADAWMAFAALMAGIRLLSNPARAGASRNLTASPVVAALRAKGPPARPSPADPPAPARPRWVTASPSAKRSWLRCRPASPAAARASPDRTAPADESPPARAIA